MSQAFAEAPARSRRAQPPAHALALVVHAIYAPVMSFRRITISVPDKVAAKAQRAVDAGLAESVSAYFAGLAAAEPDWALARQIVDELIEEIGGIDPEAEAWARSALGLDDEDDEVTDLS